MGEINKRIKQIRENEGISRTKFAELIGTTERKIQNVEQELQRVQDDLIESIIKIFPQYAYWLVTGLTIPNAGQISPDTTENEQKQKGNEADEQANNHHNITNKHYNHPKHEETNR
ncbi:MAG: helix-turn-helix transcriptional regulator [Candidatus Competibacter sp.]|nr:helix-turn-helix transcriptional regulator [Candidatus Competibacter sp.]